MTALSFHSPAMAWLLLLIPPLIALYFLKLKRPRLEVTSLALWRQVLEDQRVNSPFQRFKRNLLLWLQLAMLALIIFAAMEPFVRGGDGASDRTLVLVDRSASMAARDAPGGEARLAAVKRQVRDWIDGLGSHEEMALIAFDRTARQIAAFTSNQRVLRAAIDDLEVAAVGSDLGEALRMAEAVARSTNLGRVVLLSDGNLPDEVDFDLPFPVEYQRLDAAGGNLGVTALSARRSTGGGWSVFARVDGTPGDDRSATLELYVDGELEATESVTLRGGRGERLVFSLQIDSRTEIEVRLKADGFDALDLDNRAFLELNPTRNLRVWASPRLPAYRRAVEVQAGIDLEPIAAAVDDSEPTGLYDLVITDEPDLDVRSLVTFHIGGAPGELGDVVEVVDDGDAVVDWVRESGPLEHVDLAQMVLLERPRWVGDAKVGDLERRGYEVLAFGRQGPLLLVRAELDEADRERKGYWLTFHSDRSTLPYRVGFPVLVANLVREAGHLAGLLETRGTRTGVLPPMRLSPEETYSVSAPSGRRRDAIADSAGTVAGVPAYEVGRYEFRLGGQVERAVGAALLDARETGLAVVEEIRARELAVEASLGPAQVNRSLWSTLVGLALVVLLVEWWFFHRRPGGVS